METSPREWLPDPRSVLALFGPEFAESRIDDLTGRGGFSGANLWRIETATGRWRLKAFPPDGIARERLALAQRVLIHLARQRFVLTAPPRATSAGETLVERQGRLWELAPWIPGVAAEGDLSPTRLAAALTALAQFHRAAATYRDVDEALTPRAAIAPSPALADRAEQLASLVDSRWSSWRDGPRPAPWPEAALLTARVLAAADAVVPLVRAALALARETPAPLVPCLRDIHRDHVLFAGESVTGFIDAGSLRFECVATDLARLLASYVGDDVDGWQAGLAAYTAARPLSFAERSLLPTFDASAVLLGGLNWLRWIDAGRTFADRPAVEQRLAWHATRLEAMAAGRDVWSQLSAAGAHG